MRPARTSLTRAILLALLLGACSGDDADFCSIARDFAATPLPADSGEAGTSVADALATLEELEDTAPRDIAPDVRTVRRGVADYLRGDATASAGEGYGAANERLSAFLGEKCGIQG